MVKYPAEVAVVKFGVRLRVASFATISATADWPTSRAIAARGGVASRTADNVGSDACL